MPLVECWCMHMSHRPGRAGGVDHTTPIIMLHFVLFHNVTCDTNSIVSCTHVNTTKLCNVTCTLVAIGVILRSLECVTTHSCEAKLVKFKTTTLDNAAFRISVLSYERGSSC